MKHTVLGTVAGMMAAAFAGAPGPLESLLPRPVSVVASGGSLAFEKVHVNVIRSDVSGAPPAVREEAYALTVTTSGVTVTASDPRGEYRFYEMGKVTITRDCTVELNTWSFRAYLTPAYVEGSFNKARVFASLKFQGPAFYASDTNAPNRVWCDRVVVVRE